MDLIKKNNNNNIPFIKQSRKQKDDAKDLCMDMGLKGKSGSKWLDRISNQKVTDKKLEK